MRLFGSDKILKLGDFILSRPVCFYNPALKMSAA